MNAGTVEVSFSSCYFSQHAGSYPHASHNMKDTTQSSSAAAVCLSAFLILPWAHIGDREEGRPALMLDERSPCGKIWNIPFRTVCCGSLIPLFRSLLPYRMLSHLPPQPFVLWFGFTRTDRMGSSPTCDILWQVPEGFFVESLLLCRVTHSHG